MSFSTWVCFRLVIGFVLDPDYVICPMRRVLELDFFFSGGNICCERWGFLDLTVIILFYFYFCEEMCICSY